MTKDWTCPHGVGEPAVRGDCQLCNTDLALQPDPFAMTGDARAAEVSALLNEANMYRFDDLHKRLEELVGRPVWTHEFAQDLALMAEARSWEHPSDLNAHAIASMEALADGKPVIVVDAGGIR